MDVIAWASGLMAAVCLLPAIVLTIECVAAAVGRDSGRPGSAADDAPSGRPRLGVLIPAHDEERVLGSTLRSLADQLRNEDRLLVVADNCRDATAEIARTAGAEVIVRNDAVRRGKGWALARGRDAFADASFGHLTPEVLVIVDADTQAEPGCLDRLAARVAETDLPTQAAYLMRSSTEGDVVAGVSSLAWLVRNLVRPLGLHRFGMPCLLTGSGMALPWPIARDAPLAGGHVGEEYQLAVDLALQGSPPVFCPEAVIVGSLPKADDIAVSQRRRWSHAHMAVMADSIPRLLAGFLRTGRVGVLALALDLVVPPIMVLLSLHLIAASAIGVAWALGAGVTVPLAIVLAGLAMIGFSIGIAWWRFGRDRVRDLTPRAIASYAALHGPHYLSFFVNRRTAWTKTPREDSGTIAAAGPNAGQRVD